MADDTVATAKEQIALLCKLHTVSTKRFQQMALAPYITQILSIPEVIVKHCGVVDGCILYAFLLCE